ncbi:PAS domain S-box protein [Limnoglobus roseus]|uniref:histidine kinase n=1 Tax=Limnoglobus roseus TaxID=2598579 RepID=A0A5C1AU21_9BACT|nr:PAS domain S-box protein [Limnoglobus roseus]QEL20724.1 hybrid sensor histidine kinase/response regulator [Limnoglobus roseus]
MTNTPLRLLLVEDNPADARLVQHELKKAGYALQVRHVDDEAAFTAALVERHDVVLCDWNLPQFDAVRALDLAMAHDPDLPFVIVSGSVGEEPAVRAIKRGATDYLLKDRLGRLGAAVKQALLQRDLRAAERRAAELLSRDAQILTSVRDSVVVTDLDGVVTYWNEGATRLFGWTAAEMVGRRYADRFSEPIRTEINEEIRLRAAGHEWSGEYQDYRKDGSRVWIHARVGPITDATGQPRGIMGLAYDLTDRKRAEEALAAVMRSVTDAIVTFDEDGSIRSTNPAADRLFGRRPGDLLGRDIGVLISQRDRTGSRHFFAEYARAGGAREVNGIRDDGGQFPAELSVSEFQIEGKTFYTGVVRDTTERKRLEEQFRQAQKMEAVGRLAGGVAHDFNNLLTVINGYCDIILPEVPPESPDHDALTAIRDAGERAAALTSQLLAFSRKAIVAPQVLDLNEVVGLSEKLLRRLIGEDITLTSVLTPNACRIKADPVQLDQVIMNLAVNARDAMPTGGRLTIETKLVQVRDSDPLVSAGLRPGRCVELAVRDTGCGMSPEVLSKLFEPFFTTKGLGKGTGLGLAVVHGIVKQADGHVSVMSSVGGGTTFHVLFPEVLPAVHEGDGLPKSGIRRGTETVLLVEDETAVRNLCRIALESQGYNVVAAANGREAIKAAAGLSRPPEILVTDVVMPDMSGRVLADALRADLPGLKVLYVSGYTDDAVVRHGVREATDAFLQKPFSPLGLTRKVRTVLDVPL